VSQSPNSIHYTELLPYANFLILLTQKLPRPYHVRFPPQARTTRRHLLRSDINVSTLLHAGLSLMTHIFPVVARPLILQAKQVGVAAMRRRLLSKHKLTTQLGS